MASFGEALKKGLDAHKRAAEARKEMEEVLAAASAEVATITGARISLRFETVEHAVREASHAELAWRFVHWALRRGQPDVRAAVRDAFERALVAIPLPAAPPPNVREDEGPFGEVTNYTAGQGMNPVFEVTAITTRPDPIYRHIQATRFTDHQVLGALPVEAGMYNRIRETAGGIDVHDVACPAWCSRYAVIVQLTARFDGEARAALLAALSSPYLYPKMAIAVDDDVDIHDARDVMWAVATRVNPETDVHVIPGMRAHGLDLASPELLPPGSPAWQRVGGKMLIDATKPATWRTKDRALFGRARPKGWGVRLQDFL